MRNPKKVSNMSKLSYPENGIYRYCQENLESCINNLSKAVSECSFNIPADFTYRNQLLSLRSDLGNLLKEAKSINYCLQKIDNNYERLSQELASGTKKMVAIKIKERERMIL